GGAPDVEGYLTDQIFRGGDVADHAKNKAVNPHMVTGVENVHGGPVAPGDAFQQHLVRGRLRRKDTLARGSVDGDDVLHDSLPLLAALRRVLLGELLMSTRFKMSARDAQNGFVRERIVSS